jgi:hypothetical protein
VDYGTANTAGGPGDQRFLPLQSLKRHTMRR